MFFKDACRTDGDGKNFLIPTASPLFLCYWNKVCEQKCHQLNYGTLNLSSTMIALTSHHNIEYQDAVIRATDND